MRSDQINELATALVAAQAEFSAVPKGNVNPFFKSKYAALPDVVAHAGPVLAKHGLAVSQFIDAEYTEGDALVTYLIHSSGQFISHVMRLHLTKDDAQGQGSAVTYARRYAYMSCLGLVADDDDDGNAASTAASKAAHPSSGRPRQEVKSEVIRMDVAELKTALGGKFKDSGDRKKFIEGVVSRGVGSINDLTPTEVGLVMLELMK